jgi:hypothetical protein
LILRHGRAGAGDVKIQSRGSARKVCFKNGCCEMALLHLPWEGTANSKVKLPISKQFSHS